MRRRRLDLDGFERFGRRALRHAEFFLGPYCAFRVDSSVLGVGIKTPTNARLTISSSTGRVIIHLRHRVWLAARPDAAEMLLLT